MIALSTYSGECDGLGYAAEMAGMEVAAYCEANPKRRTKLAEKHPGKPIFQSDEELTANALRAHEIRPDIIFGGPPCQPFSVAGAGRGTTDPRHRWPHMLRLIQECRPRWVVVENVGGFVNLALDLVLADLEGEGYEAGAVVLPALAVGAPHRRDRCFVVAYAESGGGTARGSAVRCGERQPASYDAGSARGTEIGMAYAQRETERNHQDGGRSTRERIVPEREKATGEPGARGAGMAHPGGAGLQAGAGFPDRPDGGRGRAERCGESVADGQSIGRNAWRPESTGFQRECGASGRGSLVNPGSAGCEEHHPSAVTGNAGYPAGRLAETGFVRSTESRLGRILDGVSARLDGVKWPAWRGQAQHPWEPPRVAEKIPERPRRIESLGLAVVPWQAYPIFVLIQEMDDILRAPR